MSNLGTACGNVYLFVAFYRFGGFMPAFVEQQILISSERLKTNPCQRVK